MRGMFTIILGNVLILVFPGMFRKIAGNAFYFELIKITFYLKKANAKLISEAWSIFAIPDETIERSN